MLKNFCFLFAFAVSATYTGIVKAGMIMSPPGLVAGEKFRIAFVTSTTRAASGLIPDFDAFVTAAAAAGSMTSLTYNSAPVIWQALASTISVNANDSGRLPLSSSAGIFLVNGVNVTSGATDLWDGSINAPINLDESGNARNSQVWTGSFADGANHGIYALGNTFTFGATGNSQLATAGWINFSTAPSQNVLSFYGISQELTVVPEPSSILLCGTMAIIGCLKRTRRCKQSV